MKNMLKMTLILAGMLMINACENELVAPSQSLHAVSPSTPFLQTGYDLIYYGPGSMGEIELDDTRSWKAGDRVKISGTISFRKAGEQGYTVQQYEGVWQILFKTEKTINVGNDFAGIATSKITGDMIQVEFNQGVIEPLSE